MSRASIIKRLEAVEEIAIAGMNIVIWGGLPPIHVQIGKGADSKSELKLFDSMEEVNQFLNTTYPGVDAVIVTSGDDVPSATLHSWAM